MYIFDTSAFIALFGFYPKRFPTMWKLFDNLVVDGKVLSVSEVYKEINRNNTEMLEWANKNKNIFLIPSIDEAVFLKEIFTVKNGHFRHVVTRKEVLTGAPSADAFVVAKAKINNAAVVTQEKYKEKSSKIPNICEHFEIDCVDLEKFMEEQHWEF